MVFVFGTENGSICVVEGVFDMEIFNNVYLSYSVEGDANTLDI
jgi:hypothetical protein